MSRTDKTYSALALQFGILLNEPLKPYTTFKIGGPADLFAQPETISQLKAILTEAKGLNIPITLIGGGSNLLITDKGIRGLVITTRRLKAPIKTIKTFADSTRVQVYAGERLASACRFAASNDLSGLEFAAGIPGTVGGAVFMNAGTPQGNMAQIIDQVEVLNPATLDITVRDHSQIHFSYRKTDLTGIILTTTLRLLKADRAAVKSAVLDNLNRKNKTQPMGVASAGCFFKNPDQGKPAGQLIEEAGLKGFKINDAQVSKLHANYIVNLNNARCEDILELKQKIQDTVLDKFNINLETEVRIEGE